MYVILLKRYIRKIGKPLKTWNEDKKWHVHGSQEADFLHYMRLNAYYNVVFDVFYLPKTFYMIFCRVMDEIRKICKMQKKKNKKKYRNEDKRWHGPQEADFFSLYAFKCLLWCWFWCILPKKKLYVILLKSYEWNT